MRSHKKRGRFVPSFDGLEDRTVPAGNVTATISGGNLLITGDGSDNAVHIRGTTRGPIDIFSADANTTINNSGLFTTLVGFNGSIVLNMGDGSDFVWLDRLTVNGNVTGTFGAGDDVLTVPLCTIKGGVDVKMGAGNDNVMFGSTTVSGGTFVNMEQGNNIVSLLGAKFGSVSNFVADNDGVNRIAVVGSKFNRAPSIVNMGQFNGVLPRSTNDNATVAKGGTVTTDVSLNDIAGQGTLAKTSVKIVSGPKNGTATVGADGQITYVHNGSNTTSDSLVYTINNSAGGTSNFGTVFYTITGTTAPTVSLTAPAATSKTSPITFTATFSEDVTGFTTSGITVTNGTASNLVAVSGSKYTFDVTPSAQGTVTATVKAGAAKNSANVDNTASSAATVAFDSIAPTITINSQTTNNTKPTITGTVSESSATVSVTVAGQTVNATVTGTTWSATLTTALTAGTYSVSATATDAAGNSATATSATGLVVDLTPPSVTITSTTSSPTNAANAPITITFSQDVTNFVVTDITVTNGSVTNFTTVNAHTYTATLTPASNGTVKVTVPENVATDSAGNANTSGTLSMVFDTVAPTLAITSTEPSPTNSSAIPVTVTFSEDVTGFTAGDVTVSNGSISNFTAVSASVYTFTLAPAAAGTVNVSIAANAAQDLAGNNSTAGNFSIVSSPTALNTVITSTTSSTTNSGTIPITITFSQPVSDFVAGDITVTNGSISNFAGSGTTYTATLTPTADGNVSVTVAGGVAHDASNNPNLTGSKSFTVDRVAPTLDITSNVANPTSSTSFTVTFTFSEAVTGFIASDITVTNGVLSNFTGGGTIYSATISPTTAGTVTIAVAAGAGQDAAGNQSAADTFSTVFDNVAPTVTVTSTQPSTTNATSIPVTIKFSENVTGFTSSDLTVTNGSIGNTFTTVDGATYTVVLTPTAAGAVTLSFPANAATDQVGLGNAATTFSITYDPNVLTAVITSTTTSPTKNSTVPITITFSQPVSDFTASDITVTGGTIGSFAGSGTTYTATLTPNINSTATVTVAGGVAHDSSNHANLQGTFSIVSDQIVPNPTITSTATSPTKLAAIPITITFSESVTGFSLNGMTATNGTLSNFAGSGSVYTATLTPTADGLVSVNVTANAAQDAAGNASSVGTFSITSDRTAPTATITSSASDPTSSTSIPITITFNESVTGLTTAGISVTNGSISSLSGSGTTYTATITPTADGDVIVNLVGGAAIDAAGNNNAAATFTIESDRTKPTVAITSTQSGPTNSTAIPVTIKFSEGVTGFTQSDVSVSNGSISNFAGSADTYTFTLVPTATGTVSVSVAAGAAQDAAGNQNTAGTFSIAFDPTALKPTISSTTTSPTKSASFPIAINFSQPVSDFVQGDISLTNGTLSNFAGSGADYTATVTKVADGDVVVSLAAGVAHDASNNTSSASTFTMKVDTVAPTATITSTASTVATTTSIPITITFSENVTGLTADDFTVTNGSLVNFTGSGLSYTATLTRTNDGVVTVNLAAGAAKDDAGNDSAAASFSKSFDTTGPTIAHAISNISQTASAANTTMLLAGTFDDAGIANSSVTFNILKGTTPETATVTLFDRDAPLSVANFFNYLDDYAQNGGVLFHRTDVNSGSFKIIQGGGYTFNNATDTISGHIATDPPIRNEYDGTKHTNSLGTISMARTSDLNSATSEFFFNTGDNSSVFGSPSNPYAVFGQLATAADIAVIQDLASVPITSAQGFTQLPVVDGHTVDENNVLRLTSVTVNSRDNDLTYSVTSSNTSVVTAAVGGFQGNQLTLDYQAAGTSTITVTVTDRGGHTASTTFVVTVT